jgi:hypothetical protein
MTTSIVEVLRSNSTGNRPPTNKLAGEPYVNFADMQFGVMDGTKVNDLVGVRYFSTQANYKIGDCVTQGTNLYIAAVAITAGAFNGTNWNRVILSTDAINYLPLVGGTLTGTLHIAISGGITPSISLNAPIGSPMYIASNRGPGLWRWYLNLGSATAEGGSNAGSDFAISRFNDAGAVIDNPLSISRATGNVTVGGAGSLIVDGPAPPGGARYIYGTTVNSTRWVLALGDATAEGAANVGSNFAIYNYDNTGTFIGIPFSINRASGAVTFGSSAKFNSNLLAVGAITTNNVITIDANTSRAYYGRTATSITRWVLELGNTTAESGSNVGSDFALSRYADGTGAYLSTPLSIARSTGFTNITAGLAVSGGALTSNSGFTNYGTHSFYPLGGSNSIIQFFNASGTARGYVGWLNSDAGIYLVNQTSGAYVYILNASATVQVNGTFNSPGTNNLGPTGVTGALSATTTISCSGAMSTASNLSASGSLTIAGNIQCNNNVNSAGVTTANITISSNLQVNGNVNCNNQVAAATINASGYNYCHAAFLLDNASGFYGQRDASGNMYMQLFCNTSNVAYWVNNRVGSELFLNSDAGLYFNEGFAAKTISSVWAAYSDKRIKTVLGNYKAGLNEILKLNPVNFIFKGNQQYVKDGRPVHDRLVKENRTITGFVADEIMEIFPETVTTTTGIIDGKEVDDLKMLDFTNVIYALVNAVKELHAEISALKGQPT